MNQSEHEREYYNDGLKKSATWHTITAMQRAIAEAADIDSANIAGADINQLNQSITSVHKHNVMEKLYAEFNDVCANMTRISEIITAEGISEFKSVEGVEELTNANLTTQEKSAILAASEFNRHVMMVVIAVNRYKLALNNKFDKKIIAGDTAKKLFTEIDNIAAAKIKRLNSLYGNNIKGLVIFSSNLYEKALAELHVSQRKHTTEVMETRVAELTKHIYSDTEYKTIDCKNYVGMFADLPGAQELYMKKFLNEYVFDWGCRSAGTQVMLIINGKHHVCCVANVIPYLKKNCKDLDEVAKVRFIR